MKTKLKIIISAIVGVVLIVGAIITMVILSSKSQAKSDGQVTIIVLDKAGEELVNKEVGYNIGDTFFDILDKNLDIDFESDPAFGHFIVSIEGLAQGGGYWWTYTRNGAQTETGVDLQEFRDGDTFEFKLFKWE